MHSLFMTRGKKSDVDEFIKFLETKNLPLPFIDIDGKKKFQPMTGIVQPIQLWSYVFPEVYKDPVLTALKFDKENIKRWETNQQIKLLRGTMRLALGAEKIPTFNQVPEHQGMYLPTEVMENISIIPIGVKYDKTHTDPQGRVYEAL